MNRVAVARPRGVSCVLAMLVLGAASTGCRQPPAPARGLTLSVPYDLESLEPGACDRLSDFAVLSNLYEPLVTTDANLAIRPWLADRWTNPDPTTWVFHLRRGVRFHDGRPMTAEDVVASFRRLLEHPGTLEAARHIQTLQLVRAIAEDQVEMRTETPMGDFLNRVRFIHVVPANASSDSLRSGAVGTGPYRLVSHRPGESVTLRRYDGYWGPPPSIPEAVVLLNRMPEAALSDVLSGRSGFAQTNSRAALSAGERPGLVLHRVSSVAVKLLLFEMRRERSAHVSGGRNPFRDRRVREAIHIGIDRRALIDALPAPARAEYQLVPSFIFGYAPRLPPPPYDPARARALLAEAGWPGGFAATLHARRLLADAVPALRDALAGIGIRVDARSLPEAEFFVQTREKADFVLALTRFGCPTGDAANFFESGLHRPDAEHGYGSSNSGGYADPEVDRLIEEARQTLTPPDRRVLLERVMEIAMQDLPWIPLYVDEDVYLHSAGLAWQPRLDNYVIVSELRAQ